MPDNLNELTFSFLTMVLTAKGAVAFIVAVAVAALISAFAYRLVRK